VTILAFDSSLERSAYAALVDGVPAWATQSFIKPSVKGNMDLRYAEWRDWALMALDCWLPSEVVYERPTPQGAGSGHAQIFMEYTVRAYCAERNIIFHAIYPSTLKKHVTGRGDADKEAMMRAMREAWPTYANCSDPGGDIADALGLLKWRQDGAPLPEKKVKRRKGRS
jgi:hypothetical protein